MKKIPLKQYIEKMKSIDSKKRGKPMDIDVCSLTSLLTNKEEICLTLDTKDIIMI